MSRCSIGKPSKYSGDPEVEIIISIDRDTVDCWPLGALDKDQSFEARVRAIQKIVKDWVENGI